MTDSESRDSALSIDAFAASLPAEYRERFNPAQIAVHAHTSRTRKNTGASVHATLFPWADRRLRALCVVADDRAGLLSLISSALTEIGFDVDSAEAYTRDVEHSTSPSGHEAVDVFWLRDPEGRVTEDKVTEFIRVVGEILAGRPERSIPPPAPRATPSLGTTVRFLEDAAGALAVLEVETDDRSGLLWTITRALYRQNVQIVGSKIRTEATRVYDRFTIVELDGTPIKNERRLMIQVEVLSAIGN